MKKKLIKTHKTQSARVVGEITRKVTKQGNILLFTRGTQIRKLIKLIVIKESYRNKIFPLFPVLCALGISCI